MWISDILAALELYCEDRTEGLCIEKIENHFIYFTNGNRISFAEIDGFMEKTGRE